jgi:pimeloyl-ACP methyl ester carboxylesterase
VTAPPETRYARSGDVNIAYQVTGEGPFDLVYVPGFVSHVELGWQVPALAAFMRKLGSFCRLIRLDKRGTGMSDRVSGAPMLEERMDDVRAVLDAVGSEHAALLGVSEGGAMSILFAATYPERTWALVLSSAFARVRWAHDYPWGIRDDMYQHLADEWGSAEHAAGVVQTVAPSMDEESKRALATMIRQSASPGAAASLSRMNRDVDVRPALPAIRVPTLVLNRTDEDPDVVGSSRHLAEQILGARHVEIPGSDRAIFSGDSERILDEIKQFLSGVWEDRAWENVEPNRVLATVLFTDIVGSTARAAELGDAGWRGLLSDHHALIRRQLTRFRGTEIDTAGDGFFASFDGPARAIRCASAITEAVRDLGLEVRAGCTRANARW